MSTLKIAFIEPHLKLFGGIRRILELANRLTLKGEDVTIYHPGGEPCSWMECRARTRRLVELKKDPFDVVIFNNPPDYKHARSSNARLKVFYVLGLYDKERLKKFSPKIFWPIKGRILSLKRALQMPFLKISNATWIQRYMNEQLNIESELLIGGVNRDTFHPVPAVKKTDHYRIMCTGDPREFKGTRTVIDAVDVLKKEFSNIVLDTYYGKNIPQDKMAETYCLADIFLDATWDTGSGWNNPVVEAMACKVPVVCTNIGGVSDFAFDGETALLVPPEDPHRLAEATARLIRSDALREKLRERAYRFVSRFDWDQSAEALREILHYHLRSKSEVPRRIG